MLQKTEKYNYLLGASILLLLATRFLFLGDTIYIADEPLFQLKIDEHLSRGAIPLSSFRGSSIPFPYGAGALWFYMLARLVSWQPYVAVAWHALAVTAGALLLVRSLQRKFGQGNALWAGLLVASSPLLFYFSRHTWDSTLFFALGSLAIFCFTKMQKNTISFRAELAYHAILGFLLGYAINIHLMFGPVAIALSLTVLIRSWKLYSPRSSRFWWPLLMFALAVILILLPYLWEAYRIMQIERPLENTKYTKRWGDGRSLWWSLQRTGVFASIWGSRTYLGPVQNQFYEYVGPALKFFFHVDLFGWFPKIAGWAMVIGYPIFLWRRKLPFDLVLTFSFLSLAMVLLVLHYLNIPTEPHYFNSVSWLIFVGIAGALARLHGWKRKFLLGAIALTALVNTTYIVTSMAFFHENKGARNLNFSVAVSEQMRAIREICVEANARIPKEARVDLGEVWVSGASFIFLPRHMPECQGVQFTFDRKLANANFRLTHPRDSATKADLIVEWLSPVTGN